MPSLHPSGAEIRKGLGQNFFLPMNFNMSIELKFRISAPEGCREGVYLIPHENQKKWPTCTKIGVGPKFFFTDELQYVH